MSNGGKSETRPIPIQVPRDLKDAARMAHRLGWVISTTGGNHLRWQPPGGQPVFTPTTPSRGKRSVKNTLADLKRNGLPL